ncbi:MAG: hypothetical protein M3519_06130 [Actinomycetota bacterium]|nr:hypothetical protein [Actinomycetota bacterium]
MRTTTRRLTAAAAGLLILLGGCSQEAPDVTEPTDTPTTESETTATQDTESEDTATQDNKSQDTESTSEDDDDAATSTDAEQTGAGSDLITEVAMCGDDTYDGAADLCPEMSADFTTSSVHCTAQVQIEVEGALDVRFHRDGGLVQSIGAEIPAQVVGQQVPIFADTNVGELELPGGTWGCEVVLPDGSTGTGETTVAGPTEPFSQGRACDNSDLFTEGPVTHCASDSPTLPSSTPEIGCSGVLSDSLDAEVEVWAEFDTEQASGEELLGTLLSPAGVLVVHGHMTAQALLGEPEFPSGSYSCRVMVDGEEVGSHDFEVN